jgi:hypothetical protein
VAEVPRSLVTRCYAGRKGALRRVDRVDRRPLSENTAQLKAQINTAGSGVAEQGARSLHD